MGSMPMEPEAFAEQVAKLIQRMQPGYRIDRVGPRELLVNGRRLDLENLFRMVAHDKPACAPSRINSSNKARLS